MSIKLLWRVIALIKWNLVDPEFSREFMAANEHLEHHCFTLTSRWLRQVPVLY